jgi:hypothetical protein
MGTVQMGRRDDIQFGQRRWPDLNRIMGMDLTLAGSDGFET